MASLLLLLLLLATPLLLVASTCPSSCSNIPIAYPFGANPSCGAPGFNLSCSSSAGLQWLLPVDPPVLYDVLAIDISHAASSYAFLNLSASEPCGLIHQHDIANSMPPADLNVTYSSENVFILFGCNNITPDALVKSLSDTAALYVVLCQFLALSCPDVRTLYCNHQDTLQYTPQKEVDLSQVLSSHECSSYATFSPDNIASLEINLTWNLQSLGQWPYCEACEKSYGSCGHDGQSKFLCFCPDDTKSKTDCNSGSSCIGTLCSTAQKAWAFGVPSAAIVGSIAVFLLCFVRHRRRKPVRSILSSSGDSFSVERAQSLSAKFGPVPSNAYSFKELEDATECFSEDRMIGDGGFGAVYKGKLYDGRKVAVKRLYHDNFRRMEHFYNEIRILCSLQHPNLVRLYGYCCEDERDLLLVFEYASQGTVADHLHNRSAEGSLPWKLRLNIACDTAEALSYLHNSIRPPIFHRDVKTTNILLDENFHAKVADFGLSRFVPLEASHVSTAPQGTPGYLDPDYHQCYQLTDKSDVYSFGVVLVELVSALLAVDMSRDRRDINLSNLALSKIHSGSWHELVDPHLEINRHPEVEAMVARVIALAFQCLQPEKDDRPKMRDVADELANIRQSGYGGYNSAESKLDILYSPGTNETVQLIKPKSAHSPTSVQSPWPSSNTSSDLCSL